MRYLVLAFIFSAFTYSASYGQSLSARAVSNLFYSSGCENAKVSMCRNGITAQVLENNEIRQLPQGLRAKLYQIAYSQAQIWGDTILEGDYASEGKVTLDAVTLIRSQTKVIGYRIRYSERAWFVGDCAYTYNNPNTLKACPEGRIYESSFISTDLSDVEVDKNQFADFVYRN